MTQNFCKNLGSFFTRREFIALALALRWADALAVNHVMPVKLKQCKIDDHITTSGTVEAEKSEELRAGWQAVLTQVHVNRGDFVKAGQLIAEVDTTESRRYLEINEDYLGLYLNQENSIKNEIRLTKKRLANLKPLAAKGIISASEIEQFEQKLQQMEALAEQYRQYRKDLSEKIAEQRTQIKNSNFYSPINGIVTDIIVESRAMFGTVVAGYSARIAKIESPNKYIVKARLLDMQLAQMRNHKSASVHLPDGSTVTGKIYGISPIPVSLESENPNSWEQRYDNSEMTQQNTQKGSSNYDVSIRFDLPDKVLLPNLQARIEFDEASTIVQNCLPWNSILILGRKTGVKKFDEAKGWHIVPVGLGRRGRHYVEIIKGVDPNDVVESNLW
jgi:multidrug efflux pump subunit AcrA (membrane-fusion protein)